MQVLHQNIVQIFIFQQMEILDIRIMMVVV